METNLTDNWLRKLVILGTPLAIGIVELWHPRLSSDVLNLPPQQVFYILSSMIGSGSWLSIHLLQLPLFGLLAMSVYLLVKDLQGVAASVSRAAMGIFIVFYIAFDSIVGIATGILIRNAQTLPPDQQAIITQAVIELFLNPIVGDISVVSILGGGFGWVVGVFATAIALHRAGAPRPPLILLALSFIFASHPRPIGPLGMAFFFLAAVWLELFWQHSSLKNQGYLGLEKQSEEKERTENNKTKY